MARVLNTNLNLNPGSYKAVIQEWDNCGGTATTPVSINVSVQSGVHVTSPASNSTVSSPVNFVATATTPCSKGIGSMGIYTAPGVLATVINGASMNTNLSLNPGKYNAVVQEWDNCGGATTTPVSITVGDAFSNLQQGGGWVGAGQGPPNFVDLIPAVRRSHGL